MPLRESQESLNWQDKGTALSGYVVITAIRYTSLIREHTYI